jgi:hypothetical protein
MNIRGVGMVLLLLCLVGGLIAAFFTPTIAATLTLPAAGQTAAPMPTATATAVITAPASQPTMLPSGVTVLARDTFQRPDQRFWGTASDSRIWGGDANTNAAFSIVNHAGQIANCKGALQGVLNVTITDAEILLSGTVNHFDANGDINLGVVLRWQDANNWYKALINGSQIQLLKDVRGTITVLGSQPFEAQGGVSYNLRFRVQGSNLFAKAWPASQAEPANWALMVIDTQLVSGVGGIRVLLASGAIIRVTSFLETNVPGAT